MNLILGTEGFLADEFGNIYNKDLVKRNQYINADGYKTCSVKVSNLWKTFTVQKLMGVAFYNTSLDSDILINHIDGNKLNNYYKNLEISNVSLNNIHAAILNGTMNKPKILIQKNDCEKLISNFHEAANYFNTDINTIWECIKNNLEINGYKISHYKSGQNIPKSLKKKTFKKISKKRKVFIVAINTKEIMQFNSLKEAAEYFGVKSNHVHICITTDKIKIFNKKYIITDSKAVLNKILNVNINLDIINHGGRPVLTFNKDTKEIIIYKNAKEFILKNRLSKKSVYRILKQNVLENLNKFIFCFISDKNIENFKQVLNNLSIDCPESIDLNMKIKR